MIESGIYKIFSKVDGKSYVGSTNNLKSRFRTHKRELNKGTHINPHLQNAWNLYGSDNFVFEVIELVSEDSLLDREQFYVNTLDTMNPQKGYNLVAPNRTSVSELTRERISKSLTGKPLSEEHKKILSENHSDVSGERNPMYGKFEENSSFYGKHHTQITKTRISNSNKGRVFTEEHRKKLSESHKGNCLTENAKKKVSEFQKSRSWTPQREQQLKDAADKAHKALKGKKQSQECIEKRMQSINFTRVCFICGNQFETKSCNPRQRCEDCKKRGIKQK